jgi:hypothetical protein
MDQSSLWVKMKHSKFKLIAALAALADLDKISLIQKWIMNKHSKFKMLA